MINKKKILAVASAGGHWTQLKLLSDSYSHCDVHFVTTTINRAVDQTQHDIITVTDADLSNKLRLIILAAQMLIIVLRERPDVVISTGAAPGFFATLFGRLVSAKTIWVDSMANYNSLSVSGKYASRVCDLCLTQWPDLANEPRIKYKGSLV